MMRSLRYMVVVSERPVPIHFTSMAQALRLAERLSPSGWTIRVATACTPRVCGNVSTDCAEDPGCIADLRLPTMHS